MLGRFVIGLVAAVVLVVPMAMLVIKMLIDGIAITASAISILSIAAWLLLLIWVIRKCF